VSWPSVVMVVLGGKSDNLFDIDRFYSLSKLRTNDNSACDTAMKIKIL